MIASNPIHVPSTASNLPQHWRWERLKDVCEAIIDCPHSTPALTSQGPYIARSQDIRSGTFRFEEAGKVSEETYQERIQRAEPQYGDLLYSREGTYFGIAAEIPMGLRVCLGQRMVLLRSASKKVYFRFLRYWLNSPVMAQHIQGSRDGSVAERLNMTTIRNLPVAVPPMPEQRAIAHILGSLDDKIELNRRMNETLEAMARAIFKSWFVDFDPVRAKADGRQPAGMDAATADFSPDSFEDSPLGKIPKGWHVSSLDEEFNLTMGQSPPGESYNNNGDGVPFYQGRADFGFRYPKVRVFCTAPTRFASASDTLVSVRAPVGNINMAAEKCCIGRGLAAVRHRSGSRSYTYYGMRFLDREFALFEAVGTVFGSMSKGDFHAIEWITPPSQVIQAFETLVFPIDQQIESNEGQLHTLTSMRDALLSKLISGELRVKDTKRFLVGGFV